MSKENFALRLKASMAQQGKKQVDLIRAASEQPVCKWKNASASRYPAFSRGYTSGRRELAAG